MPPPVPAHAALPAHSAEPTPGTPPAPPNVAGGDHSTTTLPMQRATRGPGCTVCRSNTSVMGISIGRSSSSRLILLGARHVT